MSCKEKKGMEEILIEVFDTTLEDLQLAITLNPSIENISLAMEQYATMRVKEEVEKLKELKAKAKIKGKLKYTLGYPDIVTDEENNHIYDVRGWGNLQYDKDGEETLQARADLLLTLINSIN